MATKSDVPVDLYIATYSDENAAQEDYDGLKRLVKEDVIDIDGMVLVSRDSEGKINVKDSAHDVGKGSAIGLVGGAVVGLIFPPAVLGSALIGGGVGAAVGALKSRHDKKEIKKEVEDVLPPDSSGIAVLIEEKWVGEVEKSLSKAEKRMREAIDEENAEELRTAAREENL
jgi:uncharacterized membrane protein